jgi:ribonuclease HII
VTKTRQPFPTLSAETVLWELGFCFPAGVDEAGRGAWAGPVSAVILPAGPRIQESLSGVRDSKQMTARERGIWAEIIMEKALAWSVATASSHEIDNLGILPATRLAMSRAISNLTPAPEHLLIDAVRLPEISIPQTSLIKGDSLVLSIAAASVLAKTFRDSLMGDLDQDFPAYGFARHKGYGTRVHQQALTEYGTCPEHRFSYAPVRAAAAAATPQV